jgi:LEA14-like dessication related protein
MTKIFYLALLTSLALFFSSCNRFKQIECTGISAFEVNKVNTQGIDASILLKLKNPNKMGFTIYKSAFDVKYSGVDLGKARLSEKVKIKAGEEKTYKFSISGDFKNINLMDVMKLFSGATFRNEFEVKGDLNAGRFFIRKGFPIYIKERIELN